MQKELAWGLCTPAWHCNTNSIIITTVIIIVNFNFYSYSFMTPIINGSPYYSLVGENVIEF